jgi:hypothetical protein
MISRRHAAFALVALALAGCHEDPTVIQVLFPPSATALNVTAGGGTASTPTSSAGSGNDGGTIMAMVLGDLNLGGSSTLAAPTVPTAPTTGTELTNAAAIAGIPLSGNILVSATLQIVGAGTPLATHTITSSNGDIVISGSLLAERSTGTATNSISLSAPAGTVYIVGTLSAAGTAGTIDNPNAGNLTVNAARIVVTGSINAGGEASATTVGGKGGKVTMTSSSGAILAMGAVNTAGGTGTTGGAGGDIDLGAGNNLYVFGNLTADGAAGTDTTVGTPAGGKGGSVLLNGKGGVDVSSVVSLHGGDATGGALGAGGGDGGDFSINSAVPVRVYGSILTRGGNATASAGTSVTLLGGLAGGVWIGVLVGGAAGTPPASLELGRGTWSTGGGSGVDNAGSAKGMDLRTLNGSVTLGSILSALGGSATGAANTPGGKGGSIVIQGDNSLASTKSNHPLNALFVAAITTTGGAGTGTGNGGVGGDVLLQCGGDLSSAIIVTTTGGGALNGTGGKAGDIALTIASAMGAFAAVGDAFLSGVFSAKGGASTGGVGGAGGAFTVDVSASDPGSITSSASITTSGSDGFVAGAGGAVGSITFTTRRGDIALSGAITGAGGSSPVTPTAGASLTATCGTLGGSIISSAVVALSGGSSSAGTIVNTPGALGGSVKFEAKSATGSITLATGSSIQSDGGRSTGSLGAGGGGTLTLLTVDQFVSMFGSILLRGGAATGATGPGGLGGQVVVNTDTDANNTGGDITLQPAALIDVSGGVDAGGGGGNARNNGGAAPDPNVTPLAIAVIFDAVGGFGASVDGGNEGTVQNLGQILARGVGSAGRGGDVWWDGKRPDLADLTAADKGNLVQTGVLPLTDGIFAPN